MISDTGLQINDKYYFFDEAMRIKGKNGEEISVNPHIDIEYKVPSAEEIFDNFKEIHMIIRQFDA